MEAYSSHNLFLLLVLSCMRVLYSVRDREKQQKKIIKNQGIAGLADFRFIRRKKPIFKKKMG